MKVIKADVLGMCFGVRDALAVISDIAEPETVTIHGELVHNDRVIENLRQRGFPMVQEARRRPLPMTEKVLVTAHGVSNRERERLAQAGKVVLDTTCPLVVRAHDAAQKLQRDGYFVVVIGKPSHVEVRGIVEDLDDFVIVETPEQVVHWAKAKIGVMCQTTTPARLAETILARIRVVNAHAEVKFADTICHPTKDHQAALERLLDEVSAVVVVGGKNSNNTKQLVLRCEERGVRAIHVQSASDLRTDWFDPLDAVGLTAGTSTLDGTINEVHARLLAIADEVDAAAPRMLVRA